MVAPAEPSKSYSALWRKAARSGRGAQADFIAAYEKMLEKHCPKWKDNPASVLNELSEAERDARNIFLGEGGTRSSWSYYVRIAKRILFAGIDPEVAGAALRMTTKTKEQLTEERQKANIRRASNVVSKVAAILPVPKQDENNMQEITTEVLQYMLRIRDELGIESVKTILGTVINQLGDDPASE